MEKQRNKIKTYDFMNVEHRERPIRLFGIEFATSQETHHEIAKSKANHNNGGEEDEDEDDQNIINKSYVVLDTNTTTNSTNNNNNTTTRRFECHYCCRDFSTSQALGGHQNAHKRERQHAKRAHLFSTAAADANANTTLSYGLGIPVSGSSSSSYPWKDPRVFGSHHFGVGAYNSLVTTTISPINDSPLIGLSSWRSHGASSAETFNRDRSSSRNRSLGFTPLPCVVGGVGSSTRSLLYESKKSVRDHVSLDLHL